jgi:hypothetical protein
MEGDSVLCNYGARHRFAGAAFLLLCGGSLVGCEERREPPAPVVVSPPGTINGSVPRIVSGGRAHAVRALDPTLPIRVRLMPHRRNTPELKAFVSDLYAPSSPGFLQFLSFNEWKTRFGPSDQDLAAIEAWNGTT